MTKAPTPAEMSKGKSDNTNNTTKKFDYTAIADRLRTVSWSNYGHPNSFSMNIEKGYSFLKSLKPIDFFDLYIYIDWLVVLRINVDLAIFQPYLDLEAGDNHISENSSGEAGNRTPVSCSASQELNHSTTAAPRYRNDKQSESLLKIARW